MQKFKSLSQTRDVYEDKLVHFLYYLAFPILLLFAYINYMNELKIYAAIDMAAFVILACSSYFYKKTKSVILAKSLIVLCLFIIHLTALFYGGYLNSSFFWFFLFPLIALFLVEKKAALIWISLLLVTIFLTIMMATSGLIELAYPPDILYTLLLALMIETYIFNYTLSLTLEYKEELEDYNHRLLNTNILVDRHFIIIRSDLEGNIKDVNDTFLDFTSYTKAKLKNVNFASLCKEEMAFDFRSTLETNPFDGILECEKADGSTFWADTHIVFERDKRREKTGLLIFQQDVTQKMEMQKCSITDALTQTNNRMKFDEVSCSRLKEYIASGIITSLIVCDVDNFKRLNDNHGHAVGDEILKSIAKLLQANIRHSDTLARWGGEEFTIVLPENDITKATAVAEKMRKVIEAEDFGINERITVSFGIAVTQKGDTQVSWFNRADRALYSAKESGRNRVVSLEA